MLQHALRETIAATSSSQLQRVLGRNRETADETAGETERCVAIAQPRAS